MKKYLLLIMLFVALVWSNVSMVNIVNADVITLQPGPEGKDTWIWDSHDWSHGDWGEMRVNDVTVSLQHGLIEFDLSAIPSGAVINSAALQLYRYDGWSDSGLIVCSHAIDSAWSEDVSWSNQPTLNAACGSQTTIFGNGWYSWDITALTQKWVDGTKVNNGVALFDHGSSVYQRLVTSDNAAATEPSYALAPTGPELRPRLVIDFTLEPNNPPVAICTNVTVAADSNCMASASIDAGSSDPDSDPITITQSPAGPYGLGTHTVTLTVSDSELSDTCSATVTVFDNLAPTISCPGYISVNNDSDICGAVVTYASPSIADNCVATINL